MPEQQGQNPALIGLVHQITSRDGSLSKDSKMVNCYPEQTEMGTAVVKRPGLSLYGTACPAGRGQGLFNFAGTPIAFVAGAAYEAGTPGVTFPFQGGVSTDQAQPFYAIESGITIGNSGGLVKQSRVMWWYDNNANPAARSFNTVNDVNYPGKTTPGVVALDYTTYVMDQFGNIRGSNLNDNTTWNALNSIKVDIQLGAPLGLFRHLSYAVAFCDKGIQFYADAGNPTGSPLAAVPNGTFRTGCATGYSVVELDDITYFIGKSANAKGRAVFTIDGLQLSEISTPHINKVLNSLSIPNDIETVPVRAFALKSGGHSFYVLNFTTNGNITLVYDITYKHWHQWTSVVAGVEEYFFGVASNNTPSGANDMLNLVQDVGSGAVYSMSESAYGDYTGTIQARIVTKPYDWGTMRRKFFSGLYLLADTVASTVSVRYSDDDYQTFSAFRALDLSTVKKMLLRIGSSRRRSWEFLHSGNTPMKLYSAEVPFEVEGQ